MAYDLVTIGHTSIDTNTSNYGTKEVVGGAAFLTAAPASLFSNKVAIITRIGGDFPIKELKKWKNLLLKGIKVIKSQKSSRFYHKYLTGDHSEREWVPEFNVGKDVSYIDIKKEFLDTKCFHIATMPPEQQKPIIEFVKKNSQAIVTIDTLEDFIKKDKNAVKEVIEKADIVFLDKKEGEIIDLLKDKDIMMKMGKDGARLRFNGKEYSVKTNSIKRVVDKTGAGDVFAGVFLVSLAQGKGIKESMKKASEVATESIKEFGIAHLVDKFGR
jgi:sugar/nucleoside kinase (ribokinase family)